MAKRFDKLLVLDIDETLIYASDVAPVAEPDFWVGRYAIHRRPGVGEFLARCLDWFDVGVWTSASREYAEAVMGGLLDGTDGLEFLWTRSRCTRHYDPERRRHLCMKDLKKVKKRYRLEKVIAVDDSAGNYERSYGNLVRVSKFRGDPLDNELSLLTDYLEFLGSVPNVRRVEKRWWRDFVIARRVL